MRPCPNCSWMLQDTDASCNMCGAAIGGGGGPAPPRPQGGYAPPAPAPAFAGAPVAPPGPIAPPPMARGVPPVPPPAQGGFGGGFGGAPAPPPMAYSAGPPGGGYGAPAPAPPGRAGPAYPPPAEAGRPVSPWAREAGFAAPEQAPMPVPQAQGFPGVPQAPVGYAPQAPPAPVARGGAPVPPPVVAPPPFVSPGGAMKPGGPAPPPMIAAPPMVTAGGLPGMVAGPAASGQRILVGFLVTFHNEPNGSFWPIYSGRLQLGRAGSTAVDVGLADASASSRHATIQADPTTGQAFVEDDNSRNGTFVNEQRIPASDPRQLRDNDRLRLGSTTFVVKLLVS